MLLLLLSFALVASVAGHGGVLWPPTWQAGVATPIEELKDSTAFSIPRVIDPSTGHAINWARNWLSDQSYTGGYGDEFRGTGPFSNDYLHPNPFARCGPTCQRYRNPWAAPGVAPSLGGGCGVAGGNPFGCPKDKDTRPPGSTCGQDEPIGRGLRGTWSFGTDQRLLEFPQMITTEWMMGTVQDVVWTANGGHWGGYTYRLCKLPEEGPTAITEECFSKNILKFATNFTMIKPLNKHTDGGFDWGHGEEVEEKWEKFEQIDLSEGTFPEGSVWRPVGKFVQSTTTLRKDSVRVPDNLEPGNYVLGWRWDAANISQVNVSTFHDLFYFFVPRFGFPARL